MQTFRCSASENGGFLEIEFRVEVKEGFFLAGVISREMCQFMEYRVGSGIRVSYLENV